MEFEPTTLGPVEVGVATAYTTRPTVQSKKLLTIAKNIVFFVSQMSMSNDSVIRDCVANSNLKKNC